MFPHLSSFQDFELSNVSPSEGGISGSDSMRVNDFTEDFTAGHTYLLVLQSVKDHERDKVQSSSWCSTNVMLP